MWKADLANSRLGFHWNRFVRKRMIIPGMRKKLQNHDFTIICNNCAGGIISHDLGCEFKSPTVNLFFYGDHFFSFCEQFDYYIRVPLVECRNPIHKPEIQYPVCNLGDLELHFLHYKSFDEAKLTWQRRVSRINKNNIFIMWTFFDKTDEELLARFERLPFKNRVAFTERSFSQYPSAFHIKGHDEGIGVITRFEGIAGHRIVDQFDYVSWINNGSPSH